MFSNSIHNIKQYYILSHEIFWEHGQHVFNARLLKLHNINHHAIFILFREYIHHERFPLIRFNLFYPQTKMRNTICHHIQFPRDLDVRKVLLTLSFRTFSWYNETAMFVAEFLQVHNIETFKYKNPLRKDMKNEFFKQISTHLKTFAKPLVTLIYFACK